MKIKLHPYQLEFVFPFRIAHGIRTGTDALFVELDLDGFTAFGEATFPPYLPFRREDAVKSLNEIKPADLLDRNKGIIEARSFYTTYKNIPPPALAALDMALWSLRAKMESKKVRELIGITAADQALRSYTISVCDREEMARRLAHGRSNGFSFFKLKLDGKNDWQMLTDFKALSDEPFAVDANQAWSHMGCDLKFARKLQAEGCVLIEQPFVKTDLMQTAKLRSELSIPLIADEACQLLEDIDRLKDAFSGINVKLQKCGGITAAYEMIKYAKSLGLKVLIGCMSESSVGCAAGEVLSPLCDWNDLDGKYLVKEVEWNQD